MKSLLFSITLLSVTVNVESAAYACNNAFGCVNLTIVHPSATDSFYSNGYKSNTGVLAEVTAYLQEINGAYGAHKANKIKSTYYGDCNSFMACAKVNNFTTGFTHCAGAAGCPYANIVVNDDDWALFCSGDMSCAYANITGTYTMHAYGPYSLYNAVIDTTNFNNPSTTSVEIEIGGFYAGYNCSIYNNGDVFEFRIECYGNGCNGLNLHCSDYNCNDFYVLCSSGQNTICPNYVLPNGTIIYDADYDDSMSFFTNIIQVGDEIDSNDCKDSSYVYDTFQEFIYGSIDAQDSGDSICCRGVAACEQVSPFIVGNGDESVDDNVNVVCSARNGCDVVEQMDILSGNASVWCMGMRSCTRGTFIFQRNNRNINSNDFTNVMYCGAYDSCHDTTVINATELWCSSFDACENGRYYGIRYLHFLSTWPDGAQKNATIYSRGAGTMNVYFETNWAGAQVTIYCEKDDICNIYCDTKLSCDESTIVYCEDKDNCNIECVTQNDCPLVSNVSIVYPSTKSPTSNPTSIPTSAPVDPVTSTSTTGDGSQEVPVTDDEKTGMKL